MAEQHYEGELGEFDYDSNLWYLSCNRRHSSLHYIGHEIDGSKIKIPEGIINCNCMFDGRVSMVTPPEIPDGVVDCDSMFRNCKSLETPPKLPKRANSCYEMFSGCSSMKTAPSLQNTDLRCCVYMFYKCESLIDAPDVIPKRLSESDCTRMFDGCISLQNVPMFMDKRYVVQGAYMFDGCHPHIITAAEYNSMNPGKSYSDDFCNRHLELYKYFSDSFINDSKSNIHLLDAISNVAAWCSKTDDSRCFMSVVDAINSGILSDFEAINDEIAAVSKYYEHKQNQSQFANTHHIEGTPNLGKSGYSPDF